MFQFARRVPWGQTKSFNVQIYVNVSGTNYSNEAEGMEGKKYVDTDEKGDSSDVRNSLKVTEPYKLFKFWHNLCMISTQHFILSTLHLNLST